MPISPGTACRHPGCLAITKNQNGYCSQHRPPDDRPSSSQRGYDLRWAKFRRWYVDRHPLCEECQAKGIVRPMEELHHIIPVAKRPDLRLAVENIVSLCRSCHAVAHRQVGAVKKYEKTHG